MDFGIGTLLSKALDKVIPDAGERNKVKLQIMELEQQGLFKEQELQLSAILAEAKSQDPITSRARPSFLYVMYIMILFSLPMGLLSAFKPDMAIQIAEGMNAWYSAIPTEMWTVFGWGYLGYTGAREYGKAKILRAKDTSAWNLFKR